MENHQRCTLLYSIFMERKLELWQVVNHINLEVACEMKSKQQSPAERAEANLI